MLAINVCCDGSIVQIIWSEILPKLWWIGPQLPQWIPIHCCQCSPKHVYGLQQQWHRVEWWIHGPSGSYSALLCAVSFKSGPTSNIGWIGGPYDGFQFIDVIAPQILMCMNPNNSGTVWNDGSMANLGQTLRWKCLHRDFQSQMRWPKDTRCHVAKTFQEEAVMML